jgi:hypothetical protein
LTGVSVVDFLLGLRFIAASCPSAVGSSIVKTGIGADAGPLVAAPVTSGNTAVRGVRFLPSKCFLLSFVFALEDFELTIPFSPSSPCPSFFDLISLSLFRLSFTVSNPSSSHLTEAPEPALAADSPEDVDSGLDDVFDNVEGRRSRAVLAPSRTVAGLSDSLPLLMGAPYPPKEDAVDPLREVGNLIVEGSSSPRILRFFFPSDLVTSGLTLKCPASKLLPELR